MAERSLRALRYLAALIQPSGCSLADGLPFADLKTGRRVAAWLVARFFGVGTFEAFCSSVRLDSAVFGACRRAPLAVSRGAAHAWLETVRPGRIRKHADQWVTLRFPG